MYGIDLLLEEHDNILKFTELFRNMCCGILQGDKVDVEKFRECVSFGRNYADKQHHGKEEKILFRIMMENLGTTAEKLIRNGMLVEHDLGRYHMGELEKALDSYEKNPSVSLKLDIISNAAGYADLLKRHIDKENEVVYNYAIRSLNDEDKKKVDVETEEFEIEAKGKGVQEKYLSWLEKQS